MTLEFAAAVPDAHWAFSPDLRPAGAPVAPMRHGAGFAPFCKQLRHVVCVRGVYTDAMLKGRADFGSKHAHYTGTLDRTPLAAALEASSMALLAALEDVDPEARIDFFGNTFSLTDFSYTVVQHEALHHGQWSLYASLAGFETPHLWRREWGL